MKKKRKDIDDAQETEKLKQQKLESITPTSASIPEIKEGTRILNSN
jgi:hypothetical protein